MDLAMPVAWSDRHLLHEPGGESGWAFELRAPSRRRAERIVLGIEEELGA